VTKKVYFKSGGIKFESREEIQHLSRGGEAIASPP